MERGVGAGTRGAGGSFQGRCFLLVEVRLKPEGPAMLPVELQLKPAG